MIQDLWAALAVAGAAASVVFPGFLPSLLFGLAVVGAVCLFLGSAKFWARALGFCCFVGAVAVIWQVATGSPRLVADGLPGPLGYPVGEVAAYVADEPRWIYVWVLPESGGPPVYIRIPWQEGDAAELQDLKEKKLPIGTGGRAAPLRSGAGRQAGDGNGENQGVQGEAPAGTPGSGQNGNVSGYKASTRFYQLPKPAPNAAKPRPPAEMH